jgi:hypothetical protein
MDQPHPSPYTYAPEVGTALEVGAEECMLLHSALLERLQAALPTLTPTATFAPTPRPNPNPKPNPNPDPPGCAAVGASRPPLVAR